jgi:hypothetical protein
MPYQAKSKRCEGCGNRLLTFNQYLRRSVENAGGCGVRSDTFPELCEECGESEQARYAMHENMRRLEGWAAKEGTRRNVAEMLVMLFDRHGLGSRLRHHVRWAFTWEITGDHKQLRKLVDGLMPIWQNRVVVPDAIMGRTAEVLQQRQ